MDQNIRNQLTDHFLLYINRLLQIIVQCQWNQQLRCAELVDHKVNDSSTRASKYQKD